MISFAGGVVVQTRCHERFTGVRLAVLSGSVWTWGQFHRSINVSAKEVAPRFAQNCS